MQGRRTRMPRVTVEPLFKPFIEDRAGALFGNCAVLLVAHPYASRSIASVAIAAAQRVVVAIGPEGGFVDYELAALERAGFAAVGLGPSPLRVESACVAVLAQLQLLRELSVRTAGDPGAGRD